MNNRLKLALQLTGYVIAMAVLTALWNWTWPQYEHVSPADWHWWLRACMCAAVVAMVAGSWKTARAKDKKG